MKNQITKISMYYCLNSLSEDEITSISDKFKNVKLHSISLPCSGKINLLYLLKAIETGSEGVLLVSCKLGECKYLQGNLRARKRIEYIDDLLFETGFGRGHVRFVSIEEADKTDTLLTAINNLTETLRFEIQEIQEKRT